MKNNVMGFLHCRSFPTANSQQKQGIQFLGETNASQRLKYDSSQLFECVSCGEKNPCSFCAEDLHTSYPIGMSRRPFS